MPRPVLPLMLLLAVQAEDTFAQAGACAIDLGPDTVICQGQSVTLEAPPGFPNYLWNNGATTNSLTVGASGV